MCDGSDGIRFYVGDWLGGVGDGAIEQLMYAEGMRFLKVDGDCHYYVYEGEGPTYRWWEPVREGDFTPGEMTALLERLQVDRWATFTEADLVGGGSYSKEWQRFEVAGAVYECPMGCPVGGLAREVLTEARQLIDELATDTESIVQPSTIEVTVVEWWNPGPLDFTTEWDAPIPLEDLLDDPTQAWFYSNPDLIGTFLGGTEAQWFLDAREGYLQVMADKPPSAIGIMQPGATEASHLLFVRTVVP